MQIYNLSKSTKSPEKKSRNDLSFAIYFAKSGDFECEKSLRLSNASYYFSSLLASKVRRKIKKIISVKVKIKVV